MAKRSKAELLDLVERIVRMHEEDKLSTTDIEKTLRDEGVDISRESIRRTIKSNKSIARELMKTREETVALIDAIRDNPSTDTNEATLDYLIGKAFEYTKSIESVNFKDLPELGKFIKDMTRAKTQIVKLRLDANAMWDRAKDALLERLKGTIAGDSDLYQRLYNIVANLEAPDDFRVN
jgi:uncharacterized protein (UPF0333 family)